MLCVHSEPGSKSKVEKISHYKLQQTHFASIVCSCVGDINYSAEPDQKLVHTDRWNINFLFIVYIWNMVHANVWIIINNILYLIDTSQNCI